MDLAVRPSLLDNLSALVARARLARPEQPQIVRGFDPARQTLTLTVENASAGTEVVFRDTRAGCRIEVAGRTLAILEGIQADDLDAGSLRLLAA